MMSKKEVKKYLDEAIKYKVSIKSRLDGFTYHYLNSNKISDEWLKKRNAFISRTLPAYKKNKTYRRKLSLIMWAHYVN